MTTSPDEMTAKVHSFLRSLPEEWGALVIAHNENGRAIARWERVNPSLSCRDFLEQHESEEDEE